MAAVAVLLLVACTDAPPEPPAAEEAGTAASAATAPDLSYPGEETGTAVAAAQAEESGTGAMPPEPGVPAPVEAVRIFLVELAADGEGTGQPAGGETFGCGDRLRGVEVPVASEGLDTAGRIAAALASLLAAEGGPEVPRNLYTAFSRSDLTVESVAAVPGVEGLFRVELAGELVLGGVCDNPRVRAQLEATARQLVGVEDVEISIGGQPLEALLSGRG